MNCMWSEWSACSKSCGQGRVRRRNYVSLNPYDHSYSCIGSEEIACNEKPCPGTYLFLFKNYNIQSHPIKILI